MCDFSICEEVEQLGAEVAQLSQELEHQFGKEGITKKALAAIHVRLFQLTSAITALIDDPSNPHSAAQTAREALNS